MTKIRVSSITLQGAKVGSGENPLPRLRDLPFDKPLRDGGLALKELQGFGYQTGRRVLPYTMQDSYSRDRQPMQIKTILLENDCLRATFLPEYGGRLYSLFDKKKDRELLYVNPVFQPANLALRDAWFSGGIEWNCGQFGHCSYTCEDVFFARCTHEGEDFLRMYCYERTKGWYVQIDFHLPSGEQNLIAHVNLTNANDTPNSLYWWTNIALPIDRMARVFSGTNKVIATAPSGGSYDTFYHDELPTLKILPDRDATYPVNCPFSCEYFFQNPPCECNTWEGVAYEDGTAFYERSTACLPYRKMFTWANNQAGRHWQEFLSERGNKGYFEIQAGVYPTQVHGGCVHPNEQVAFTQVFGGANTQVQFTHAQDWQSGCDYLAGVIDGCMDEQRLLQYDQTTRLLAKQPVGDLLHSGTGWGALEEMRQPGSAPASMCFSPQSMDETQAPWLTLLQKGSLPDKFACASFMTDARWRGIFEEALAKDKTAGLLMHYGILLYESGYVKEAQDALEQSVELGATFVAYGALSALLLQKGEFPRAAACALEAFNRAPEHARHSCAIACIKALQAGNLHAQAWKFFCECDEHVRANQACCLCICPSAYEVGEYAFLEEQFNKEFASVREGDSDLSQIWMWVQAHKMAQADGTDFAQALQKAAQTLQVPYEIDFRTYIATCGTIEVNSM